MEKRIQYGRPFGRWWMSGAVTLGLLTLVPLAGASSWIPAKNVEIIVATGPGGGNDRAGRTVQNLLRELKLVNVTTTLVNKPGAGGVLGSTYLNQHAGDAHYVSTSTPALLTTHITGRSDVTYTDVTPIAQLYSESSVFLVKTGSSIQNAKDLIERIKRDSSGLTVTIGTSTANNNHIALGALTQAVGGDTRKLKTVVFKSSSEATTAVLGGHVDLAIVAASSHRKQVEAGNMKVLAVASPQRLPGTYANVPTWKELGVNVVSAYWIGIIGPRGLSQSQTEFWDRTFGTLARSEEWKNYLNENGLEDAYMDSQASRRFLDSQYKSYKEALTSLGLAKTSVPR